MLKKIADLLYRLMFQPGKTWHTLSEEQDTSNEDFFKRYLYPVFGVVALLAFIGIFFTEKEFDVQLALKVSIKNLISVFAGFYLAVFLLMQAMERFLGQTRPSNLCERFIGYSSSPIYIFYLLSSLFPDDFFFLRIFELYVIYIIWEGAGPFMEIEEDKKQKFTLVASVIVLLTPFLIDTLTFMLMPGLRV